jgi:SAM-dependent methyltransferase
VAQRAAVRLKSGARQAPGNQSQLRLTQDPMDIRSKPQTEKPALSSADAQCPICSGPLRRISRRQKVTKDARLNWESDSTLELLGDDEASIHAAFCTGCFHTVRMPQFDTSVLYGPTATAVRARHYKKHNPESDYGQSEPTGDLAQAMNGAARELARFRRIMSHVSQTVQGGKQRENREPEFRILDWGGGDGAASAVYADALRLAGTRNIQHFLFDPSPRPKSQGTPLGESEIPKHGPYQLIILSHVLEHTHSPVALLEEAARHLADDGVIVVEVPDERMNYVRSMTGARFSLHYHVQWFSARSLARVMRSAGLSNVRSAYNYRSAYSGRPMTTIIAAGGKPDADATETVLGGQSRLIEAVSVPLFALRKIIGKVCHAG